MKTLIYYDHHNQIEYLLPGDLDNETIEEVIARELSWYDDPDLEMIYVVEGHTIDGEWYFPLGWAYSSPTVAALQKG